MDVVGSDPEPPLQICVSKIPRHGIDVRFMAGNKLRKAFGDDRSVDHDLPRRRTAQKRPLAGPLEIKRVVGEGAGTSGSAALCLAASREAGNCMLHNVLGCEVSLGPE